VRDFFEVFGLGRTLAIDGAALQRRFYELSRQWHPDFHQAASAEAQARALQESAHVNAAYRALRDPLARVEYLIRLEEGRATGGDGGTLQGSPSNQDKPKAPPALLAEMFEIQEALEEAKAGALDDAARATLSAQRDALQARMSETEAQITGRLSQAWDAAPPAARPAALKALEEALATRAYLRTVIDDLANALDGSGDVDTSGSESPRAATASPGRAERMGGMGGHIGGAYQ
jgi:molecular chaperone HscB